MGILILCNSASRSSLVEGRTGSEKTVSSLMKWVCYVCELCNMGQTTSDFHYWEKQESLVYRRRGVSTSHFNERKTRLNRQWHLQTELCRCSDYCCSKSAKELIEPIIDLWCDHMRRWSHCTDWIYPWLRSTNNTIDHIHKAAIFLLEVSYSIIFWCFILSFYIHKKIYLWCQVPKNNSIWVYIPFLRALRTGHSVSGPLLLMSLSSDWLFASSVIEWPLGFVLLIK